uniref:Uncharacterized protein n=1 Tax=Chromera velia CCMP2878 TaxID=1169474 RepID=A0A0G4F251_9ALVE|eukprot:Cvel_14737.t1-p1 / transcript=Cvel_14737.t1 / gene=Cvel_14737 / organism=Chromera_velia_CCMP2878 / gene_product=hypothetical protein / transcript_product=hypothetical protein / location=Cvel_scaffold1060:28490-30970(-) / protein_length=499 / sequence_SO=supercontig / SO=protein_coding / is_pseudo=false
MHLARLVLGWVNPPPDSPLGEDTDDGGLSVDEVLQCPSLSALNAMHTEMGGLSSQPATRAGVRLWVNWFLQGDFGAIALCASAILAAGGGGSSGSGDEGEDMNVAPLAEVVPSPQLEVEGGGRATEWKEERLRAAAGAADLSQAVSNGAGGAADLSQAVSMGAGGAADLSQAVSMEAEYDSGIKNVSPGPPPVGARVRLMPARVCLFKSLRGKEIPLGCSETRDSSQTLLPCINMHCLAFPFLSFPFLSFPFLSFPEEPSHASVLYVVDPSHEIPFDRGAATSSSSSSSWLPPRVEFRLLVSSLPFRLWHSVESLLFPDLEEEGAAEAESILGLQQEPTKQQEEEQNGPHPAPAALPTVTVQQQEEEQNGPHPAPAALPTVTVQQQQEEQNGPHPAPAALPTVTVQQQQEEQNGPHPAPAALPTVTVRQQEEQNGPHPAPAALPTVTVQQQEEQNGPHPSTLFGFHTQHWQPPIPPEGEGPDHVMARRDRKHHKFRYFH